MKKLREYCASINVISMLKKIVIIASPLIVLFALFYWFQIRPAEIRKECYKNEVGNRRFTGTPEDNYNGCLRENGLKN